MNLAANRLPIERALTLYRESLAPERKILLDRYRLMDLALKVVGVGDVGDGMRIRANHGCR